MTALFSFDSVTVRRDDTVVLDAITLEIPARGITVLVGASGSGKSTLLRCCNRLEAPSSGTIRFRGEDLATLDPLAHRRRVAMVFQTPTVFAGTGLDNLRAADPHLSADDARALLTRVGLPNDLLDREADTLSGGEAQRLCLARALATRPQAILADESTSALDGASTAILERLVRQLADDGIPVVWVTHDLAQMERLADRVIELEDGRIVFTGTSQQHAAQRQEEH
jgi:putative ABC transport system ATP-binding protein